MDSVIDDFELESKCNMHKIVIIGSPNTGKT